LNGGNIDSGKFQLFLEFVFFERSIVIGFLFSKKVHCLGGTFGKRENRPLGIDMVLVCSEFSSLLAVSVVAADSHED